MLTPRQELLLSKVIDEFSATGQPVGSKALAADPEIDCGPSTIRNELAVLEELGLLAHPHTSAGRVPTDAGDNFGAAIAAYFLNGPDDAFGEFAVGAPGENIEGADNAGAVTVHFNDPAPPVVADTYTQTRTGGLSEQGDMFGAALG